MSLVAIADTPTLKQVIEDAPEDQEPLTPFPAWWSGLDVLVTGVDVTVTCVLNRTAVVEVSSGEKYAPNQAQVLVDPAVIRWQRRLSSRERDRQEQARRVAQHRAQAGADCQRCGKPMSDRNRSGECMACQKTCPECKGPKWVKSARCRTCEDKDRQQKGGATPSQRRWNSDGLLGMGAATAAARKAYMRDKVAMETEQRQQEGRFGHEQAEHKAARCPGCSGPLGARNRTGICQKCQRARKPVSRGTPEVAETPPPAEQGQASATVETLDASVDAPSSNGAATVITAARRSSDGYIPGLLGDIDNLRQMVKVSRMFLSLWDQAEPRIDRLERQLRNALKRQEESDG